MNSVSSIRFCTKCDNKYYHRITENALVYHCRVCGFQDPNISNDAFCVLDTQIQSGVQNFDHIVNRYTKFDPVLPHLFVRCPNDVCKTNTDNASDKSKQITDAIFIRYDDSKLKFLYICTECDTKWKTDDIK